MKETFDDPRLKAALQQCWGGETAPAGLRATIEQMFREGESDREILKIKPVLLENRRNWFGYAIAAGILLAAGLMTWGVSGGPISADERFPNDVATSMITTHDHCCQGADHHHIPGIRGDDFAAIAQVLSGDLKVPVLSTPIEHWQFAGAGPCPVWGHESAHLLYRDGSRTLSVFSIPASDFSIGGKNEDYSAEIGTHELAGFVKDRGLYCVVANSPDGEFTLNEAELLRDQLRHSVGAAGQSPVVVRENLPTLAIDVDAPR